MDMPSRHISPQSFDEILSDLGDDPAIADPHGIRKTGTAKRSASEPREQPKSTFNLDAFSAAGLINQIPKLGGIIAFAVFLLFIGIGLFIAYESLKTSSQSLIQESHKDISRLKNDLDQLRIELEGEQDELYTAIESVEVSIHSLSQNKPARKAATKPQVLPHEAELRRWRYLGVSQMGGSQQAFFHNGKTQVMLQKGVVVLGDWRLMSLEKDFATLTHAEGKTLTLKPSKTE
jgi:hypothetical protein